MSTKNCVFQKKKKLSSTKRTKPKQRKRPNKTDLTNTNCHKETILTIETNTKYLKMISKSKCIVSNTFHRNYQTD